MFMFLMFLSHVYGAENLSEVLSAQEGNIGDAKKHFRLGVLLEKEGNIDDAKKHYQAAINKDGHSGAHVGLAVLLDEEGNIDGAKKHYQAAINKDGNSRAHFRLGVFLEKEGNIDDAKKHYQAAINKNGNSGAYFSLGVLLEKEGNIDDAKKHYQAVINKDGHPEVHFKLGVLLEKEGNIDGAKKHYQAALNKGNISVYVPLLNILLEEENLEEALRTILNVPENARLHPIQEFHKIIASAESERSININDCDEKQDYVSMDSLDAEHKVFVVEQYDSRGAEVVKTCMKTLTLLQWANYYEHYVIIEGTQKLKSPVGGAAPIASNEITTMVRMLHKSEREFRM